MAQILNEMMPGNPRYQPRILRPVFGYDHLYRPLAEVEIATMRVLAEMGIIPADEIADLTPETERLLLAITTSEVDEIERSITLHDVRAWVRLAQQILGESKLTRWVHVPLTSYDPLDTARILQFLRAHHIIRGQALELVRLLMPRVAGYAQTVMVGRTHGQHALPITIGFWLATFLSRVLSGIRACDTAAEHLVGKISGAVGAHNAQVALRFTEVSGAQYPQASFEERVLAKLDLRPARISTQILPPEPLANYLFQCVLLSAAIGQFGRDCRHLMRSEIAEVAEGFAKGQVGSSTMAHKRNPIRFEGLEGAWLKNKVALGLVTECLLSEHQRDLVGSALLRDLPVIVVNLCYQLETLLKKDKTGLPFIERIRIDEERCRANLDSAGTVILAEPLYLALQMAGYEGDAHALINERALPLCSIHIGRPVALMEAVRTLAMDDPAVRSALEAIPGDMAALFDHPELYVGDAAERALLIATDAQKLLDATASTLSE